VDVRHREFHSVKRYYTSMDECLKSLGIQNMSNGGGTTNMAMGSFVS